MGIGSEDIAWLIAALIFFPNSPSVDMGFGGVHTRLRIPLLGSRFA